MHYPPETSSIMLMARMVAVVKQVRLFNLVKQEQLMLEFYYPLSIVP